MEVQKATREFRYNSVVLPDPDPNLSLEQVRDTFAAIYPEIVNADIEGPEAQGAKVVYTFRRAVGTKGAIAPGMRARLRASARNSVASTQETMNGVPCEVAQFERAMSAIAAMAGLNGPMSRGRDGGTPIAAPSEILPPLP